ncbi:MAG: C1 family peptidase [Candidatus Jettenia caeni]|nr:MAG: C1 family peptidase [Candidatus Jettenia caeni]
MALTFGKLREVITRQGLTWQTGIDRRDDEVIQFRGLGGDPKGLSKPEAVSPINFHKVLDVGTNPLLALRRLERGFISREAIEKQFRKQELFRLGFGEILEPTDRAIPPGAGAATSVDWRNRWGANWITSIRDQNGCNACWAFAGVALVEAMVRIEDAIWTRLSEGDVHRGIGAQCADYGNIGNVSNFFVNNGFADPGCFPWTTNNPPYTPTQDRNGRTVRGPAFQWTGTVQQAKDWIDTVGPLITWLEVWNDFFGYSTGVYRRSTDPSNTQAGSHFMLVIGYSDALQAWLCKNSWGQGWGMNGYCWIAYGDSGIDSYAKAGVRNVNSDPWSKRRLHNGNLYESGNGSLNRNLEVMGANGSRILHRWREGGPPWTWGTAGSFATDAAICPTLTGTTFNRNMEVIYLTTSKRLHHWWGPGGGTGPWNDGGVFGPNDCLGVPGFIQGDYNAPGNFEIVVLVSGGQLQHLWRDGAGWHLGPRFGNNLAYSGATLVQSTFGSPHGSLELVAVSNNRTMQHFWRNEMNMIWNAGAIFGSGITSPPVMIQGQYGIYDETGPHGNFELCVAAGERVQHWWRWNSGDKQWRHSATFGHDVLAVAGLCESQWGMNLEVIVLRTDNQLQHYWRDRSGWYEGPIIGQA